MSVSHIHTYTLCDIYIYKRFVKQVYVYGLESFSTRMFNEDSKCMHVINVQGSNRFPLMTLVYVCRAHLCVVARTRGDATAYDVDFGVAR